MTTAIEALQAAESILKAAHISSARLDAEVLLAHIWGCGRAEVYLEKGRSLTEEEQMRFQQYIARRKSREPVAYIIGYKEFWSIPIKVTPAVLIPRPETEMLVEKALTLIANFKLQIAELKILDLCTGSGCITAALARELPEAEFTVTDLSSKALAVARENLSPYKNRVHFSQSNLFEKLKGMKFDLIVSNPPYLNSAQCETLEPEILRHEPMLAIDGGLDGQCLIKKIKEEAPLHLHPHGFLVMEIGPEILLYIHENGQLKHLST